jgi:hypothetical protein
MHNSDYYREEAAKYRELADMAKDAVTKQELLELAAACEGSPIKSTIYGQAGNQARNARANMITGQGRPG